MSYRSPLEARVAKKTTKAIKDFNLVEDGDRVMVGLSGGKDSWALLQILDELRQRAPIDFSLIAVNVDSGYKEFKHDVIAKTCRERGWEYRIEHTAIGEVMDDLLEANATPCSLCARLRRGVLYRIATEVGATKIALGHHLDDFIETLLLNLFFAGALKAMPARLVSDNGEHVVIRPLVYVEEAEARVYTKERGLPIIGCCCPACGDLSLQRQRQAVDAEGARQRHAEASPRCAAQSERRAARQRGTAARGRSRTQPPSNPAVACGRSFSASPRRASASRIPRAALWVRSAMASSSCSASGARTARRTWPT
jgi:tRNA 2-thiocytidine biosynthesis protein TtcA